MKVDLKKNSVDLKNLKVYDEVSEFIDNNLRATLKYENVINFFLN